MKEIINIHVHVSMYTNMYIYFLNYGLFITCTVQSLPVITSRELSIANSQCMIFCTKLKVHLVMLFRVLLILIWTHTSSVE